MPAKPTTQPTIWANTDYQEYVINNQGESVLVDNKDQPDANYEATGILARGPVIRGYLNWILNHLGLWIQHLHQKQVNDYVQGEDADTTTTIATRYGGTWSDLGTQTVGAETIRWFKKTAD